MKPASTPANDARRLAALYRYAILDTEPEDAYDRLTRTLCHIYAAPIATVTFVDEDRQWFKSARGITDCQTSRAVSFCGHVAYHAEPLVIDDTHQDERFRDNPLVTGPPHVRAYAGVPICSPDGFAIGVLCVQDQVPRAFSEADLTPLHDLAQTVTDELELRRAHRDLERERNLFLGGPTVVLVWEPEPGRWPIRYVSANVAEVLGYRPEELVGTDYGDLIDPEDRKSLVEEDRQDAAGQLTAPSMHTPYRLQAADGSRRWIHECSAGELDEQGRRTAIRGYINDITDQVERERALKERQRQHDAIFYRADSISLVQVDLHGTIQEASRGAEALFGYAREELIGRSVEMLHPQQERSVPARLLARLRRERQEITEEVHPLHRSGTVFPALLSLAPILDEDGEIVGVISVCMDLSQQTAERERYRLAQEAARFGIWEWDLEHDAVHWDDATWRMLGHDPAAEGRTLRYADWQARVHPEDLLHVEPVVQSHIARGEPFTIEFRYRRADGGWLWVQARGQIMRRTPHGQPQRLLGTHVEIEQLKHSEIALRQRERWLGELQAITASPARTLDDKLGEVLRLGAEVLGLPYARVGRVEGGRCIIRAAYPEPAGPASTGPVHEVRASCCAPRLAETPDDAMKACKACTPFPSSEEGDPCLWLQQRRLRDTADEGGQDPAPVGCPGGDGAGQLQPPCDEAGRTTGAYFVVPLESGGASHDVLLLYGDHPRAPLTRFERQFLRLLGQWLTYELTQEAQHAALVEQASRDGLTGAYNRAPLEARLEQALAQRRRYGSPAGLILLDVDHFKALNDSYGHSVGDQILCALVARLQQELREPDVLARWGGEEFAILVPETDGAGLHALAERLRESVVASPLLEDVGLVSVSVGATLLEPEDDTGRLQERVDQALYQAKRAGRNQVVLDEASSPARRTDI